MITCGEESAAVEIPAAGPRYSRDENGPLLVFSAEIRRQHLELLDEIRVGVDRCIAVTSRIGNVRAVLRDVQGVYGQTVIGVGGVERTLAAGIPVGIDANRLPVVVRLVLCAVANAEARHNFDVLGGVASDLSEVRQFFGCQRKRLLARVDSYYCGVLSVDLDGLIGVANGKRHVDVALFAATQADTTRLVRLEAGRLHRQGVRSDGDRRERKVPFSICHRVGLRARYGDKWRR